MQNANTSGIQARFANQRFQQAIAQEAIDRLASNATHRLLKRDPSRIFTTPPLTFGTASRPKPGGGRLRAMRDGPAGMALDSTTGNVRKSHNNATGTVPTTYSPKWLYTQVLPIISRRSLRARRHGAAPVGPWPPGSVFEYGSPANRQLGDRIESRLEAVADWLREQVYSNEKDPVRTDPLDLQEQLTKEEAESGSGEKFMEDKIKDPRIKGKFDKMKHNHIHGDGKNTDVHYLSDRETGESSEFKFKDHLKSRGRLLGKRK